MAFPTAASTCVREKRRTPATVENAADLWIVDWPLSNFLDHERAVFLRSDCSSIAVGLQSLCSRFAVFALTAIAVTEAELLQFCSSNLS